MINTEEINNNLSDKIRFVSHELRNHLSICDMYSQILRRNLEKDGINDSSIDNALCCIQKSIQIMSANLIDLKSVNCESKRYIDFKSVVEKGIELSKACNEDKEIEYDFFIKNSAEIFIDENRFLSCIVNIIKNGIESIEIKGKVFVYGEVKDGNAILKIGNNGKPIPKDKQNKIFEVGFTTKKTGSGYGLHICKQYLKSQNAQLNLVKSTKNETVFEIVIPV